MARRGPSKPPAPEGEPNLTTELVTAANQTALYRTARRHAHIHIDPEAAAHIGQPRPIMHGLCTLAASTLPLARELGVHPADLKELQGRFAAPMFPVTPRLKAWVTPRSVVRAGPRGQGGDLRRLRVFAE